MDEDNDMQQAQQEQDERRSIDPCECPSWWGCSVRGCYVEAKNRYPDRAMPDYERHARDLTTSGADMADRQREISKQYEANHAYSQRLKERR